MATGGRCPLWVGPEEGLLVTQQPRLLLVGHSPARLRVSLATVALEAGFSPWRLVLEEQG